MSVEAMQRPDGPEWFTLAWLELGESEVAGSADNPRIREYLNSVRLGPATQNHDEVAWCSAFVNWCVRRAGLHGTDSPVARSWLKWGRALDTPRPGAVTVVERGLEPWQGHVALFVRASPGFVYLLGGNQRNRVSVQRFAAGVVLGLRWPTVGN
jgi:uncharacterized protein (TIGR02594 family)